MNLTFFAICKFSMWLNNVDNYAKVWDILEKYTVEKSDSILRDYDEVEIKYTYEDYRKDLEMTTKKLEEIGEYKIAEKFRSRVLRDGIEMSAYYHWLLDGKWLKNKDNLDKVYEILDNYTNWENPNFEPIKERPHTNMDDLKYKIDITDLKYKQVWIEKLKEIGEYEIADRFKDGEIIVYGEERKNEKSASAILNKHIKLYAKCIYYGFNNGYVENDEYKNITEEDYHEELNQMTQELDEIDEHIVAVNIRSGLQIGDEKRSGNFEWLLDEEWLKNKDNLDKVKKILNDYIDWEIPELVSCGEGNYTDITKLKYKQSWIDKLKEIGEHEVADKLKNGEIKVYYKLSKKNN